MASLQIRRIQSSFEIISLKQFGSAVLQWKLERGEGGLCDGDLSWNMGTRRPLPRGDDVPDAFNYATDRGRGGEAVYLKRMRGPLAAERHRRVRHF